MSIGITTTELNKSLDQLIEAIIEYTNYHDVSFACWKKPNTQSVSIIVDTKGAYTVDTINLEKAWPGFIISPFDQQGKTLFLNQDILLEWNGRVIREECRNSEETNHLYEFIQNHTPQTKRPMVLEVGDSNEQKNEYMKLVEKSVDSIKAGMFSKVVPSRSKKIKYKGDFELSKHFITLCQEYKNAFVSMHYTSHTGLWMGASPEILLETKGDVFRTVALAGTQSFNQYQSLSDVAWTQKEIEEQALVSRYIINCFKKIRLREFNEYGPKTVKAGNLIHLKTIFEVDMKATNFAELGSTMLELLHPTSAVCGMPLESSMNFIKEEENYNRELFSGFIGPVNIDNSTNIFVNLRCMKIGNSSVTLYAGAGVTEDSNPVKEWLETDMKMNTLLNVISKD